jgi:hypothetical protein
MILLKKSRPGKWRRLQTLEFEKKYQDSGVHRRHRCLCRETQAGDDKKTCTDPQCVAVHYSKCSTQGSGPGKKITIHVRKSCDSVREGGWSSQPICRLSCSRSAYPAGGSGETKVSRKRQFNKLYFTTYLSGL